MTNKKEGNMSMELARQKTAQAWCTPETEKITMDPILAEAFATILDDIWSKPWLGNATTGELLEELKVRCEINRTINYSDSLYLKWLEKIKI